MSVRVAGPQDLRAQVSGDGAVPFTPVEIADRPGPGDLNAVRALRQLGRGADVMHAHGLRAGALTVMAARSLGSVRPAVVVTLHNLPVGGRAIRGIARVLEGIVARGADAVLGVSGDLVERARSLGARRTERALVPAPPRPTPSRNRDAVREELGVPTDAALLVTVGRLAPQKGMDLLLDAAEVLAAGATRVHWVVAGEGPMLAELHARTEAERLPVSFLGRREDVADLMAAADVVVNTALWEGQPLGVQEALALDAAVVATDVGGTGEVTGDAADLVEPAGDAIAAGITRLLHDPSYRDDLRSRASRRAAELPDLAATLDQLERVWLAAAAGRGPSGRA